MRIDLLGLSYNETVELVKSLGEPAYRADQLYTGLMRGCSVDEISNLPKKFKEKLSEHATAELPKVKRKLVSKIDGTIKYLFELCDGKFIESVFMEYKHGNTLCVSSEVGCPMGCKFCASTLNGLDRKLGPGEILGQIIAAQKDTGKRISNVVMMGIGEPLHNYENVIKFLHLANDPHGLNIGYRHISLSTCGLADKIRELASEELPITLSISLHSADNEERAALMPVTNKFSVEELLDACSYYFRKTGRRISFEYTLIAGKNDGRERAAALARKLKKHMGAKTPLHVNLIPLNEVKERPLHRSDAESVREFALELGSLGVNATVRRRLGSDINASCGQLRNEENTSSAI